MIREIKGVFFLGEQEPEQDSGRELLPRAQHSTVLRMGSDPTS